MREANRKRAKRPKVKTGCQTCKIRRVKCDETRPECLRCQKFGKGYCDGYENTKTEPEGKALQRKPSTLIPKLPFKSPAIQPFNDENEYSCFRSYCEEIAPRLSFSNRNVWHRLLLQAGQAQPFIRHAIIAIGALNRSTRYEYVRRPSPSSSPSSSGETYAVDTYGVEDSNTRIHSFALEHYGKFLQGAKSNIVSTKEQGRRIAMISCLLVVCIENMQYRYENALSHAQKGLALLEELKESTPEPRIGDGPASPTPDGVEDELVHQFNRMELQVMAVFDARMPSKHRDMKKEGHLSIKDMPERFPTIGEAELYLNLIMRRTMHFMASALAEDQSAYLRFGNEIATTPSADGSPEPVHLPIDISKWLRNAPEELSVEQEIYASENRRWAQAYEPIYRPTLLDRVESFRAMLLKLQSIAMDVRMAGHLSNELVYDNYIAEFREIVNLSRIVLTHPQSDSFFAGGRFCFDMGLIYPLMTPAMSCRDRKLRRQAISLLGVRSWREAQWSSDGSVDVATFLMEVEEEGVETEYIPGWARARLSGIDANVEAMTLTLRCIRGVGSRAKSREKMIQYGISNSTDSSGFSQWSSKVK